MNNKKAILAIWHIANKGKTHTLRELATLLRRQYPNFIQLFPEPPDDIGTGDFQIVIKIVDLVVAIESQGDPNTNLEKRLLSLVDGTMGVVADVIFCSTRTRGETVGAVECIAGMGYEAVWTSTYQTGRDHEEMNRLKARHILELMINLGLMPPLEVQKLVEMDISPTPVGYNETEP
jgi:hypothetical protein